MFVPAAIWFVRLPDRTIYRVPPPWSILMHGIQLFSLGVAVAAARVVGLNKITGLEGLFTLFRREAPPREPEAQGPPWRRKEMVIEGPFLWSRHPLNLAPLGVFLFFPRMTVNLATLVILSAIYLVVGSMHEEVRLRAAYGKAYSRYQASGVPFYLLFRRTSPGEFESETALQKLKSVIG
jgi:protein-S-isoprenylcysteine O-methyltransferase Ste14